MYDAKDETTVRAQKMLMIDRKKISSFFFENLNSQLMKVIEFKKYDFKIDQNSSRSITRVKRFY